MPEDMIEQGIPKTSPLVDRLHQINPFEKLSSALLEKHHPYALLLMSTPFISAATGPGSQLDAVGLGSSSLITDSSSDTKAGTTGKLLKDLSSAGSLGLSLSGHSPEASLSMAGLALSSMEDTKDRNHSTVGALLSVVGLSAATDPNLANALRNSFEFDAGQTEAMVVPLLASGKQTELKSFSDDRIEVQGSKVRVGSVVANTYVYSGRNEFTITGEGLVESYGIKPGDKFLALHVNQGGGEYAKMEPLSRVKAIKRDFQQLCALLEKPDQFGLTEKQNQQIEGLSNAPMIGVSHLVRLIATQGLPTWGIEVLPKAVQKFHTFDSQIVSRLFGGGRKVNTADIRVMFLPASMRSQVTA